MRLVIKAATTWLSVCRPVWRAWLEQAVLAGRIDAPGFVGEPRPYLTAKWIPQGWQWVDPQKEFNALKLAIRAGLTSRSEAISSFGYDAEEIDREIAADNARAHALRLVFDSDPRQDKTAPAADAGRSELSENPAKATTSA